MIKNFLAFLGLLFLSLVIMGVVAFLGLFYDDLGIIKLPPSVRHLPATLAALDEVKVYVQGPDGPIEWKNPVEARPAATMPFVLPTAVVVMETPAPPATPEPSATPPPTFTSVPPLDSEVYRVAVTERLKIFASALERWVNLNQKVSADTNLLQDATWQDEMRRTLSEVATSGRALADVGPAPWEYRTIDTLLDQTAQEAEGLAWNYTQAIDGSAGSFQPAGENFARLKGYLQQAAQQMIGLGWDLR